MPIYQLIRLRVLQSLVYVIAHDPEEAVARAKGCPYTEDKEILTDEEIEIVWRWDDDDQDAPDPTPRE